MKGWEEIELGKLFQIKHGWAFKGEFFDSEGKLIIVTPGNFYEQGGFKIQVGKEKFYTSDFPKEYLLKKDDVIIAMTEQSPGLLGSPALVPKNFTFLHNQRIGLITNIDTQRIHDKYIYYLFFTNQVRDKIAGSATGTKVKHTAPVRIYQIKVRIPSVLTQRRIASILSAYDDLIENNLKRIKLLEELAQRTYEEWFVKFRVNGEQLTVKTETGLPEGWERRKLVDVASLNKNNLKKAISGTLKYIDISSVSTGNIDSYTEYEFNDAPGRARRIVKHGDIIWSCVRPNRKSYSLIWNPEENMIASTGFAVITPIKLPTSYLYQFVTAEAFVGYLTNLATGAAYPAVTSNVFEEAEIVIPKNELIELYDITFKPTIDLISKLQTQNRHLKTSRDLLLPRLMNGSLAVTGAE